MLKVLIIDADADFASHVGRSLVQAGHETRIVGDAQRGIASAKAHEADLVLVGAEVPGVTITQVIEELKPHVPGRIVVCGNSDKPDDIKTVISAGANDYILRNTPVDSILARAVSEVTEEEAPEATEEAADPENSDGKDEAEAVAEVETAASTEIDAEIDDDDAESGSEKAAEEPAKPKLITPSLRTPVKDGKRPFVVVVAHEDPEKRAFQKEIVERLNASLRVVEASTSEEAITAAEESRTVMVMIDWSISSTPAKQAMKTIREGKNGKSISLFVTYKSRSPEKQRVAEFSGAISFAGEPWDDGSLEGQIKHTLDVIRKRRRRAKIQALKAQEAKSA